MDTVTTLPDERLPSFIRRNMEPILVAWEEFARGIDKARHMNTAALRDHASGMLLAIADDLESDESVAQQHDKAQGRAPAGEVESEAALHGAARVAVGFSVDDTVSEFRALRASVLQLWSASKGDADQTPADDTMRFNEAIDEALAESMERYALDKDEATRRFDTLLSSSPDLQCILTRDCDILYANKTLKQLLSSKMSDLVGNNIDLMCPPLAPIIRQDVGRAVQLRSAYIGELRCTAEPERGPVTYRCVYLPVINDEGDIESITASARDISELKASEDKILRHAYYDSLTDLPNRMLFRDRLEQELRHAGRTGRMVGLLYIDLDGFKEVNDRHGHAAGDLVLQETAKRILSCVRSSDTVARLGGDEFTVILTEVSKPYDVDILAQEVLALLAQPFALTGTQASVSGSIGITLFPRDGNGPEDLIRNADQAMFAAKKAGRNRYSLFTTDMRDSAWARLKVIDELRQAVGAGQLAVYYQPIVDMQTGVIAKAEALVRWRHPVAGMMLPEQFIGLAEETGLIGKIDSWVLEEALFCARLWSDLVGSHFQVSVNKSPVEFMTRTGMWQDDIDLARLSTAEGHVAVEITENVMLNDSPCVREKLRRMQLAGVQLAIDDFGTGYASLAYLKKFKVDFLKIDQSFVQDMLDSPESRVFAETIVLMAHRLGLKVIAEGVETAEQRDWLHGIGCDYAQGFLYAQPADARAFGRMLSSIG